MTHSSYLLRPIAFFLHTEKTLIISFTLGISAAVNILTAILSEKIMSMHQLQGLSLIAGFMVLASTHLLILNDDIRELRSSADTLLGLKDFTRQLQSNLKSILLPVAFSIGFSASAAAVAWRYCELYLVTS